MIEARRQEIAGHEAVFGREADRDTAIAKGSGSIEGAISMRKWAQGQILMFPEFEQDTGIVAVFLRHGHAAPVRGVDELFQCSHVTHRWLPGVHAMVERHKGS